MGNPKLIQKQKMFVLCFPFPYSEQYKNAREPYALETTNNITIHQEEIYVSD